jgi:hypothetical protein
MSPHEHCLDAIQITLRYFQWEIFVKNQIFTLKKHEEDQMLSSNEDFKLKLIGFK